MGSIRLVYDAEGDILDVDFRLTGEKPRRGVELHENVTVWTDAAETQALRLTLLSYSRLCAQPDLVLSGMKKIPPPRRTRLLELLGREPIRRFLVALDEPALRFRVAAPGLKEVAAAA